MTITLTPKIGHSTGSFANTGLAQCGRVLLHCYNAVVSDVKDKFEESETFRIIRGIDSSVTAATEQKLRTHARKLVTLSPLSSLQQIPKLSNTLYFFLGPKTLDLSFQKAYMFKHFLNSDWSVTSFYAVSALSTAATMFLLHRCSFSSWKSSFIE